MDNINLVKDRIAKSIAVKQQLLANDLLISTIAKLADEITTAFKNGGKVLFCGNGGSAADAQHLAAELSGRFYTDRDPLPSEALHVNTSYLTAVANDYSYDEVYSRMIKAVGKKGDVLIGISTSGNSKNVIKALEQANTQGMVTASFTGDTGGKMKTISNYLINVPSSDTPRIQESHILVGHILCEMVENNLFPKK
jgi:D-sedoheptulose 7-phosphate isomerase